MPRMIPWIVVGLLTVLMVAALVDKFREGLRAVKEDENERADP